MNLIYLILTLGGVSLVTTQSLNGKNVDEVVAAIRRTPEPSSNRNRAPAFLAAADRDLQSDQSERNFKSLFSTKSGPDEFFTADEASREAVRGVEQSRELAEVTNQLPTSAFRPRQRGGGNGAQTMDEDQPSGGLDEVNIRLEDFQDCVYDKANSEPCTNSKFREPTARCTNTMNKRKTWAMAGTPFTRIIAARYEDGVGSRRVTGLSSGLLLESPREISATVTATSVVLDFGITSHVMQWGQFIAHEFTQLAEADPTASCCPDQIANSKYGRDGTSEELQDIRELLITFRADVCQQIEHENDPVHNEDICINHVRSKATPQHNCRLGPRQQMNAITHVFDASNVYGSSQVEQNALRENTGGKMKTQEKNGAILPPQDTGPRCPNDKRAQNKCPFLGGDSRINTTPNLISAHTAFLNKHNQIANGLSGINPSWDDERLFQESRRIISAIQSNIHFYEWLPVVISDSVLTTYRLKSYDGFDKSVNPSVLNELAAAAMRFGHSMIRGIFSLVKDNDIVATPNLRPSFFDSDVIYDDGTKQCAKGLSRDPIWSVNKFFPTQMRDFLLNQISDIVALNINRGRDHGFGSYVDYRRHYGLSVPNSFSDLSSTHPPDVIADLDRVYTVVGDVELYIGGVTERPMTGGLVGELFANILADGFSRSRKGDRFFFESDDSGLTSAQISAIRNYKYSQLLCEGNRMDRTLSKAFFIRGRRGSVEVDCSSFTPLDLSLWGSGGQLTCPWKIIRTSRCCRGRRIIRRRCDKSPGCQCPNGKRRLRERCRCPNSRSCRRCRNRG